MASLDEPYLIQVAGHGNISVSAEHLERVIKQTVENEVLFYERIRDDPNHNGLSPFVAAYFRSACVDEPKDKSTNTRLTQEKLTHIIEIENLCLLAGKEVPEEADCYIEKVSRPPEVKPFSRADYVGWSPACVLDLKLGKIRYTPLTHESKVHHTIAKDRGSTSDILGLRISGLSTWRFNRAREKTGEGECNLISWQEGKSFGRALGPQDLLAALGKFFTVADAGTESVSNEEIGRIFPNSNFESSPHLSLVKFYLFRLRAFAKALDESNFFARCSFTSSSLVFLHSWKVERSKVLLRADLRLVDFAQSGYISDGTVLPDSHVGVRTALSNLVALLEDLEKSTS